MKAIRALCSGSPDGHAELAADDFLAFLDHDDLWSMTSVRTSINAGTIFSR